MSQSPRPVLGVSDLTVRFAGAPANVVDGISFAVEAGRTLAIVGESGCGKSVTSMALMGLLPATASVTATTTTFLDAPLLGRGEAHWRDVRGNRLAMIFQDPMTALNPVFTIGDQITETIVRHQGLSGGAARNRALDMLKKVRVPDAARRLDAYPHQLSGGLRQRVVIAMALANAPALIIADEPTTALDVTIQAQILSLIAALQAETGTAMILITHDLGVVAEVADDVAVMYAGRIVESGPVGALFDDPQHPYTIGLMGSMPSHASHGGASRDDFRTRPDAGRNAARLSLRNPLPFRHRGLPRGAAAVASAIARPRRRLHPRAAERHLGAAA